MITPINIALLGVVLAAVALILLRRRRSGTTDAAVSPEMPDETMTTADEPPVPVHDDVFSKHVWAEAAATLTPVREDEAVAVADADLDAGLDAEYDDEGEPEDEAPGAVTEADDQADDEAEYEAEYEADDEAEDDADDLDAPEGEHAADTGEIQGLELEDMVDPDDGLREIITEPGWYLPGETDMTRGSPGVGSGSLIPQDDLVMSGGLLPDEPDPVIEAPSALAEDDNDFSATAGWASAVENGAEPAEPSWLGLAHEEGAAAAVEHEVSFEAAPSPSDDLFALPPSRRASRRTGRSSAPPRRRGSTGGRTRSPRSPPSRSATARRASRWRSTGRSACRSTPPRSSPWRPRRSGARSPTATAPCRGS